MAKIYANLIKKGVKTLADTPVILRDDVTAILTGWGIGADEDETETAV